MANNRPRGDKKSYTFTMSTPDMVWTCVGAVFALTVFFLFGVLVGRGYLPTDPESAGADQAQVETSTHGQLTSGDPDQPSLVEEPESQPKALKAEELGYQDQLDKPAPKVGEPDSKDAAAKTDQAPEAAEAGKAAPEAPTDAASEVVTQAEPGKYDPSNLPAPEPGEEIFQYTYQAAAFKDEAAANELAATLQKQGVDANVAKGVTSTATWYRVQIPFTGTPSQTRPMRDLVETISGEKPVMVSKKAAQ